MKRPGTGLNSRKYKVGRTTVEVDRRGYVTYFEREGVSVPCVCDPETGIICQDHERDIPHEDHERDIPHAT